MGKKKKKKTKTDEGPKIAARFQRDLDEVRDPKISPLQFIRDLQVVDPNQPLIYTALILPQDPPYNNGAFRVKFIFPIEYPFRPPTVVFMTRIYHMNIDEKGRISMPIIWSEHWCPTTTFLQIIQTLIALLHEPMLENSILPGIAREYLHERNKFMAKAMEYTSLYAEDRSE